MSTFHLGELLKDAIDEIARRHQQKPDSRIALVVNGDVVDFLAAKEFAI